MGHSRIDTTLNIYSHVTKDKAEEVMQNLNGKIKNIIERCQGD